MKMQKSVISGKKNWEINMWKKKKYNEVRNNGHYTGEYRGAACSICNLKYSVPEKIHMAFHNGSDYNYHFAIKCYQNNLKYNLLV